MAGLDIDHHEVIGDPDLALLLADAEGRMAGGLGAAIVEGRILHLSSKPGGTAQPQTVRSAEELIDAVAALPVDDLPHTAAIHLDLDLDAPFGNDTAEQEPPPDQVIVTLHPSFADSRVVVVAGPGVARSRSEAGLVRLAKRTGWQVLNSWGAKGVLAWFDDHHAGTVGLQALDLDLAEVAEADLVVASGLDPDELGVGGLGSVPVQEVAPRQLAALTHGWAQCSAVPAPRAPFYGAISAAVTPMYESTEVPLAPARAALHLSGARPEGGIVVADAGVAGFWLARTFPTREVGSIVVPATLQPGFAVAAALVAGVSGRPCVAVVDGPMDEPSRIVAEAAASMGVGLAVQVWAGEGSISDAQGHARLCEAQFAGERGAVEVPIRRGDLDALVDVAGPVVAWPSADMERGS